MNDMRGSREWDCSRDLPQRVGAFRSESVEWDKTILPVSRGLEIEADPHAALDELRADG